jgi:predicted permease
MTAIADTRPPFWIDVRLDTTVLAFVMLITVAATLVSSLLPGLRVARTDASAVLKDDGRGSTSVRMGRFSRWLVIVEVAVSCVLLVVSGLMIRSIVKTSRVDYPFATRDVFFATAQFEQRTHPDNAAAYRAVEALEAQLARLPGARRVTIATSFPGSGNTSRFVVEGKPDIPVEQRPNTGQVVATPSYFDTLGVSVLQGRLFTSADAAGSEPVLVIDQAFAAKYLTGGPVLGRRIRVGDEKQPWRTIIGVVPDLVVQTDPAQTVESVYIPYAQMPMRGFTILVRTAGEPTAIASAVRAALAGVSPESSLNNANALDRELWRRGWALRLFGGLFLLFGAAALLMAAAGLYGVMSFTVRRRTHEIGVRMALGASRNGVLRMVLWQGIWRVGLGIALGLWPGWFLATQMRALLQNVSPSDPVVHVVTAVTLLVSGAVASLVPAFRASSIDPLTALRD